MIMLRAAIIDDETDCREAINNILNENCPDVTVIGQASSVVDGAELIIKEKPDILFLDIQLDDGDAFDILEELKEYHFHIIFITAYDQYAIQAIKHSAIDYILKPVDPFHLIKAIDKIKRINLNVGLLSQQIGILLENRNNYNRIALPTLEGFRFINLDSIVRCQAESNYTWFFLKNSEKILVTKTLKEYEETLSESFFIRIHHSHLINTKFIEKYVKGEGGFVIMNDGSEISVSRRRKESFLNKMKSKL